ncbi:uncharacterized protein LOC124285654 [Haliotis rubra]|uniref:uncharacterized protein LOC124285654 n=1 Tax=Haliotis rubra TaxID=36100 RepID=UPI001EE5E8ED|nr:uncharacterized protein LOC124285654 [Haliotis rubra]
MSGEGYKFVQDATNELHKKLDDLEKRAVCLGEQYDHLLDRAGKLEQRTNEYMFRIEKDRKMSVIVELLMRRDKRSELLIDYVWVFFEVVLRKVKSLGVPVNTIKELWLGLRQKATEKSFTATMGKLGFSKAELDPVLLLFEVVHDRTLAECGASKSLTETIVRRKRNEENDEDNSWMRDADVASLILYLQIQDELQTSVRGALRRVVAVAHCGLMGADDTETCLNLGSVPSPELASHFLTSTPKITPKIRRSSSAVPFSTELLDTPTCVRPVHSTQNANTAHLTDRLDSASLTSGSTPSPKQDASEPSGAGHCRGSHHSTPMSDTCETSCDHQYDSRVSIPDTEGKSELKSNGERRESDTAIATLKCDSVCNASSSAAQDMLGDNASNRSDNRYGGGTYDTSTGCQKCVRFSPQTVTSECDCNE